MQLKKMKTKLIGANSYLYDSIDSTQKEIWRRVKEGKAENGCLVSSKIQTDGIGTHGRTWYTDENNNIAFSFYINMNVSLERLDGLTRKIAEIILEVFKEQYNIKLDIKEPNDVYCRGKKLGGILTETKISEGKIKDLVVGIGINTNKDLFNDEIINIATSIKREFNIEVDNEVVIEEICKKLEKDILERIDE